MQSKLIVFAPPPTTAYNDAILTEEKPAPTTRQLPLCRYLLTPVMHTHKRNAIADFWVAGINYKKSDASVRGCFSVSNDQYVGLLEQAGQQQLQQLFVLSTCNRTEIYGFAENPRQLIGLICSQTQGDAALFTERCYLKRGEEALQHLFQVSAGLDSQILGDYEIVGQIKQAVKFAKERGFIGPFLERLINSVLQSSKAIKNQTQLSGGTVSVSFAAVQYIRESVPGFADKKYVLLGTGKIGRNTCKNLVDYLGTRNVVLINRTEEKAAQLARTSGLRHAPYGQLGDEIANADVVLVATNAPQPTILKTHLEGRGGKVIIDLSVPSNVAADASALETITLVNVDELSRIKDETLQRRQAEVPKALAIIEEHLAEFLDWHQMRRFVPILVTVKSQLQELNTHPHRHAGLSWTRTDSEIQKVINGLASKMKQQSTIGCNCIQAINEFMS